MLLSVAQDQELGSELSVGRGSGLFLMNVLFLSCCSCVTVESLVTPKFWLCLGFCLKFDELQDLTEIRAATRTLHRTISVKSC